MICHPCTYVAPVPRKRVQVSDVERSAYDAVRKFIPFYRYHILSHAINMEGPAILYKRTNVRQVVLMRALVFHYLAGKDVSMATAGQRYLVDRTTAIYGRDMINQILEQSYQDRYKDAVEWFYKTLAND